MNKNKIKKLIFILLFLSIGLSLMVSSTAAQYRFPEPEFTKGYQIPSPTQSPPTIRTQPMIALVALIMVMLLTAFLLYKVRSRGWLRLLIILSVFYFGFYHGACICPVGSIQNVSQSLFNPNMLIALPVIGAFLLPLLLTLFWGRIFCGAACPLGAIQELVIIHPVKVPDLLDRCLRLMPYIYFGLAVLLAACNMRYIICEYDPFVGFFRFSGKASWLIVGGMLLLIGTVIARPYCRYLCPYSVLLRIMAKLSARKVSITPDQCVVCHLCQDACPVGAIQAPRPNHFPEDKEKTIVRLQWIASLTPFLLIGGIIFGSFLSIPLSNLHPEIKMLREIQRMQGTSVDARDVYNREVTSAEAFLMKGHDPDELYLKALSAQKRLKIGSIFFGIYFVLIILGAMVAASRRRTNEKYTVDAAQCICCARCYQSCPQKNKSQKHKL